MERKGKSEKYIDLYRIILLQRSHSKGPIKMRQFIFTHTSGPVPRHAVLGVGGVQ